MFDIRKELGIGQDQRVDTRRPTHGSCCTCQTCGYGHDECMCQDNALVRVAEMYEAMQSEHAEMLGFVQSAASGGGDIRSWACTILAGMGLPEKGDCDV